MIKRSLLVTLSLLVAWQLIVACLPDDLNTEQYPWNTNIIYAQNYLYSQSNEKRKCVLVGTSFSAKLRGMLPKHITNLGFRGLSPQDGLSIIRKLEDKHLPKQIVVEINYFYKPPNEDFQQAIFSPMQYEMRKHISSLRQRHQPSGVLKGLAMRITKRDKRQLPDPPLNQTAMQNFLDDYASVDHQALTRQIDILKADVDYFRSKNVTVYLVDFPIHDDLTNLAKPVKVRELIKDAFPSDIYHHLVKPEGDFPTSDGVHLVPSSARRYAEFLIPQLNSSQ